MPPAGGSVALQRCDARILTPHGCPPSPPLLPQICKSTATVAGGKVIDEPTVAITACPAGSYLVTNQYCHAW